MGDVNQLLFIRRHLSLLSGPFLEVGSKDYGSTQDVRSLVVGRGEYVGADLAPGPNVDVVLDFTDDFARVDQALGARRFGTIFCLSVLEHCEQPFRMADNLTRLLRPGARICVSAPFAWKFHAFPSDYWRFTPEGIKRLFPHLRFDPEHTTCAGALEGQFGPPDEDLGRISLGFKAHRRAAHPGRGLSAKLLSVLAWARVFPWLAGQRYILLPTNVMMIGTLEHASEHS